MEVHCVTLGCTMSHGGALCNMRVYCVTCGALCVTWGALYVTWGALCHMGVHCVTWGALCHMGVHCVTLGCPMSHSTLCHKVLLCIAPYHIVSHRVYVNTL